jgi:lysophospholipase L1-like esterase
MSFQYTDIPWLKGRSMPLPCVAPPYLIRFENELPRTARRLASEAPVVIVALGSSSTAGAGASSADAIYPARLATELQDRWAGQPLTVLNRGINGEDAREMLARFDADVTSQNPDLVIWQLGTNWLLQGGSLTEFDALLRDGIRRLVTARSDVVLVDPQFAPQVIAKPDLPALIRLLSDIAEEFNINVFRRCAIMRHWHEVAGIPFDDFLSEDELHMNDWSYDCMAKLLAAAIAGAATASATVS